MQKGANMTYQPLTCVWEITMGCNMRCKHCGSSCSEPLPDELSTEEALDAIRQMVGLGLKWVTLSGGEPFTRRDLPMLVKGLSDRGILVNIITNGWLVTDDMARELKSARISTIGVDGTRDVHDRIRKPGSYERLERAFRICKDNKITAGAVTTITKENIGLLPQIKEELIRMGSSSWQVQLGLPMGNLAGRKEWLLGPEQVDDILDFCYKTNSEGRITLYPADCLGYYSHKELLARQMAFNTPGYQLWDGCNAGVRGFGFLHNGDVLGCTSIRDREYIEGNIRDRPLKEIWEDRTAFQWWREMTKEKLSGHCQTCKYGSKCLGGCPNTRLTMNGNIYGENQYCSYNVALKKSEKGIKQINSVEELLNSARRSVAEQEHQLAAQQLERLLELDRTNAEALRLKGCAEFMNGNYALSENANRRALEIDPKDGYAKKGLGLALFRQGKKAEGIALVEEVVKAANYQDADAVNDLEALYHENGQPDRIARLKSRSLG
jgi:radical SAM protein with 4Fe4S-binding SPASM domain